MERQRCTKCGKTWPPYRTDRPLLTLLTLLARLPGFWLHHKSAHVVAAPVAVSLDPHRLPSEEIERAAWCGNSVYHDDWEQGRYDDRCGACRRSRNAIELLLARLRGEAAVRQEK